MATTRDNVKEIQGVLSGDVQADEARLAELAESYSVACRALNERVYRCLALMRQGLRSEAVELAKRPPDIREELYLLDFADMHDWADICEQRDLTIPDILDTDAANSTIDELYAESDVLNRLLRVHRRMAIGQAPLADRLRVLRRIQKEDAANDVWKEDVRVFEEARLEEMAKLAGQADRAGDLSELEAMLSELMAGDWAETAPTTFIRRVDDLAGPHRKRFADEQFAMLLEQIRQAQGAMDETRCRGLLGAWRGVTQRTGVEAGPGFAGQVAPVQEWLADLDRARQEDAAFDRACAALERAIDESEDRAILEKLAADVLRFERSMPEVLAARFNSHMEGLHRASKRKFALTLTGVIGAVLLLAAGAAVAVMWHSRNQARQRWQKQIIVALEKRDYAGADKLIKQIAREDAGLYKSPEIRTLQTRYQREMNRENLRKQDFEGAMASLAAAGAASADPATLAKAGRLASSFQEKALVQDWTEKIQTHKDEQQRLRERQFELALQKLETLIADLNAAGREGREDFDKLKGDCLALSGKLVLARDVPALLQARAKALDKSIAAIATATEKARERATAIAAALKQIPVLQATPAALARALKSFARSFPTHPLSADFDRAAGMAPHWLSAMAHDKLITDWAGVFRASSTKEATARVAQIDAYLKAYPGCPRKAALLEYRQYLQAANTAMPDGQLRFLSSAKEVFNDPLMADAMVARRKNGTGIYYVLGKEPKKNLVSGRILGYYWFYIVDGKCTEKKVPFTTSGDMDMQSRPSPQAGLSKAALKMIADFSGTGWESFYLRLAEETRACKDMDPILKANVLKMLIELAVPCMPRDADKTKGTLKLLSAIYLDVPWMDPDDENANRIRPQVARMLGGIKTLMPLIDSVEGCAGIFPKTLKRCYPIGIVLGEMGAVEIPNRIGQTGDLCVISSERGAAPAFVKIGELSVGRLTVDKAAVAAHPRGTPIFLRSK